MTDPGCTHPGSLMQYLEPADAVAELIKRPRYKQGLIDLVQSADPGDDVDVHLCLACGELLLLVPDKNTERTGLSQVWVITDRGKGMEDPEIW
jgi:hypothetical protein